MRTTIRTLGIAAAGLMSVIGVAGAADPYQDSPESRAYVGFSFGGDRTAPRDLHYGLRFDQDSRLALPHKEPIMQIDFTRRGFTDARVNGLSVLKHEYRLQQNAGTAPAPAEGSNAPAAPAQEEGFFSGMWHGVKNFFGGLFGSSEPAAAAPAEAAPAAAAPAEAAAGGWSAMDWGLLAVGVAGVGLAGSQAIGKKDTPDPNSPGGVNGNPGSGGGGGGGGGLPIPCVSPGVPPGCTFTANEHDAALGATRDVARQEWLDADTGHMGDLAPQN